MSKINNRHLFFSYIFSFSATKLYFSYRVGDLVPNCKSLIQFAFKQKRKNIEGEIDTG